MAGSSDALVALNKKQGPESVEYLYIRGKDYNHVGFASAANNWVSRDAKIEVEGSRIRLSGAFSLSTGITAGTSAYWMDVLTLSNTAGTVRGQASLCPKVVDTTADNASLGYGNAYILCGASAGHDILSAAVTDTATTNTSVNWTVTSAIVNPALRVTPCRIVYKTSTGTFRVQVLMHGDVAISASTGTPAAAKLLITGLEWTGAPLQTPNQI